MMNQSESREEGYYISKPLCPTTDYNDEVSWKMKQFAAIQEQLLSQLLSKMCVVLFLIGGLLISREYYLLSALYIPQLLLALLMLRFDQSLITLTFTGVSLITLSYVSCVSLTLISELFVKKALVVTAGGVLCMGMFVLQILIFVDGLERFFVQEFDQPALLDEVNNGSDKQQQQQV